MRLARVALFLLLWCWNQSGPLSIPVQRNEDARVVAKVVRGVPLEINILSGVVLIVLVCGGWSFLIWTVETIITELLYFTLAR